MDIALVHEKLEAAKMNFLILHRQLLEINANERSITHKFAECMTPLFEGWDVDCEYNRDGYEPKRIVPDITATVRIDNENGVTAFPDIIVHHRRGYGRENNLLAIEAKKDASTRDRYNDFNKLHRIKQAFDYQMVAFINFLTDNNLDVEISFDQ